MIRIIKGIYTTTDGVDKTPASEPFTLNKKREAELVKQGVAVIVETTKASAKADAEESE